MPYQGKTTQLGTCAICKSKFPKGTIVYFDASKSQGNHLAHKKCYEDLIASREPRKPAGGGKVLSSEPLDPPF